MFGMIVVLTLFYLPVKTCLSVESKPAVMDGSVCFFLFSCGDLVLNIMAGGPEGLRSLTSPKAIIIDRWPSLIQTSIPKVLDYPLRSLYNSWFVVFVVDNSINHFHWCRYISTSREFSSGLVRFLYGDGWRTRIGGLLGVISAARKWFPSYTYLLEPTLVPHLPQPVAIYLPISSSFFFWFWIKMLIPILIIPALSRYSLVKYWACSKLRYIMHEGYRCWSVHCFNDTASK